MNNLRDTGRELRKHLGAGDPFMTGGHQILVMRKHNRKTPEWTKHDIKVQEVLRRSFPHLLTNKRQAAQAGRWARVIQLYFRMGYTHGQIAEELETSYSTVLSLIRSIKRVAEGQRADGSGKFKNRFMP
jgi:hypothetical protein